MMATMTVTVARTAIGMNEKNGDKEKKSIVQKIPERIHEMGVAALSETFTVDRILETDAGRPEKKDCPMLVIPRANIC